jgi:hypothetical protein
MLFTLTTSKVILEASQHARATLLGRLQRDKVMVRSR